MPKYDYREDLRKIAPLYRQMADAMDRDDLAAFAKLYTETLVKVSEFQRRAYEADCDCPKCRQRPELN